MLISKRQKNSILLCCLRPSTDPHKPKRNPTGCIEKNTPSFHYCDSPKHFDESKNLHTRRPSPCVWWRLMCSSRVENHTLWSMPSPRKERRALWHSALYVRVIRVWGCYSWNFNSKSPARRRLLDFLFENVTLVESGSNDKWPPSLEWIFCFCWTSPTIIPNRKVGHAGWRMIPLVVCWWYWEWGAGKTCVVKRL